MKIGELARRSQCQTETIRFYEREGLLPAPLRTAGNYRVYGARHVERLAFIRNCRALDMTLDEIRQLLRLRDLPQDKCAAAHALLDEHVAHVGERISELQQLERQLQALRRQCQPAGSEHECAILDELSQHGSGTGTPRRPHVRGTHRS
ncbi:MAG: Cd(II)/Pb(II)-responsive transcriptional regulator [Gammaproteobacteria bacterium]|nr:Cd(II)/Pb(II)-responsive transcriptional regulator [Gammaproteobacteria bacterium]MBV9620821.1 Cd(II)/Pb(II)-responsive transcriptional regulator [Gammaproteobacteria bacterium]